jgi:hypothetical protein
MGGGSSNPRYRHAGCRASTALWITVCCALAAGCAASESERDAAQHVRTDASDDFFFIRDAPDDFPPLGPPVIRARVTSPQHLTTNLNLMVEVEIAIYQDGDWYGVPDGTAEQSLKQAFGLKTLQGALGVTGTFTFDISYTKKRMTFSHTAPFEKDTDYLVTMTKNKYVAVAPDHSRSVFHTGSLPRVKLIGFLASKASPALVDKIIIFFSEGIDQATAIKSVTVKETATGTRHLHQRLIAAAGLPSRRAQGRPPCEQEPGHRVRH